MDSILNVDFRSHIRYQSKNNILFLDDCLSSSRSTRNIYMENLRQTIESDTDILRGDLLEETYESM